MYTFEAVFNQMFTIWIEAILNLLFTFNRMHSISAILNQMYAMGDRFGSALHTFSSHHPRQVVC